VTNNASSTSFDAAARTPGIHLRVTGIS
jgi:hypothetical protein